MEKISSLNAPSREWSSQDLPNAWKSFRHHVEFMFGGSLLSKNEEQECNYLMIWVGEKGRDIYQTWSLAEGEEKKLKTYYDHFEIYVKLKSNKVFVHYKFH